MTLFIIHFGKKREKCLIAQVVAVYSALVLVSASPAAATVRLTVMMVDEYFDCYGLDIWRGSPGAENLFGWRICVYIPSLEIVTSWGIR